MTSKPRSSVQVTSTEGKPINAAKDDGRSVIWFDLDNCVYSKNSGISEMMKDKIRAYFRKLGLPEEEAAELHHEYFTTYGLAIRGLVRHHDVDPLEYDKECDASLPLDTVLFPDPALQSLLASIDRKRYRVWALTNAYVNHAVRVLSILELAQYFEGVVSCDYGAGEFSCKPEPEYFAEAVLAGGQPDPVKNYFVDDSALNIRGAHALGWGHAVLFDELGNETEKLGGLDRVRTTDGLVSVITNMQDLKTVWKEIFVDSSSSSA